MTSLIASCSFSPCPTRSRRPPQARSGSKACPPPASATNTQNKRNLVHVSIPATTAAHAYHKFARALFADLLLELPLRLHVQSHLLLEPPRARDRVAQLVPCARRRVAVRQQQHSSNEIGPTRQKRGVDDGRSRETRGWRVVLGVYGRRDRRRRRVKVRCRTPLLVRRRLLR